MTPINLFGPVSKGPETPTSTHDQVNLVYREKWSPFDAAGPINEHAIEVWTHDDEEDEEQEPEQIGHVALNVFDDILEYHPHDVITFADHCSDDCLHVAETFYGREGEGPLGYHADSELAVMCSALLYVCSVEVAPKWRGQGLGLVILGDVVSRYGRGRNVAWAPRPMGRLGRAAVPSWRDLLHNMASGIPLTPEGHDEACRKLRQYWSAAKPNQGYLDDYYLWDSPVNKSEMVGRMGSEA